ncbi:MAG: substrate-binding domain-containing protein [Chloroflexota bacterium]|jgi:ribose transport system substrate-binding protein|nr:substrate-binding domain-containing protein [Chloroflexota bacterium]
MKKTFSIFVLFMLILSILSACSTPKQVETQLPEQSAPSDGERKLTIGFSLITQTFPYYVQMLEGMKSATVEKGWSLIYTEAGMDVQKTINDCLDLLQKDIDVLVIASWYGDSLSEVFEQAKKENIPVFLIDTGSLPPDGDYVTNIGTENFDAGFLGGYWAAKEFLAQGKQTVKLLSLTTSTSVGRDRVDGFLKGLEEGGLQVEKLNEVMGDSRESYMSSCEDAITTYDEIDLVFGANAQAGLGCYDSIVAAKRTEVRIIGFDGELDEQKLIDEGTQYIATIMQLPKGMAEETIKNIEAFLYEGATFEKQTAFQAVLYTINGTFSSEEILSK